MQAKDLHFFVGVNWGILTLHNTHYELENV